MKEMARKVDAFQVVCRLLLVFFNADGTSSIQADTEAMIRFGVFIANAHDEMHIINLLCLHFMKL